MASEPILKISSDVDAEGALVVTCFPSLGYVTSSVAHYLIDQLELKMKESAKKLDFEEAANLRDRIKKLRQKLVGSSR